MADASEFEADLEIRGEERFGYRILSVESSAIANSIAAILLHVRDRTDRVPHIYFSWTEGSDKSSSENYWDHEHHQGNRENVIEIDSTEIPFYRSECVIEIHGPQRGSQHQTNYTDT